MKHLEIDIETYSPVNLQKSGVYKYAESDDFELLLFGYSVDGGEVQVVDLASGEEIPADIIHALTEEEVTKWAFNSQFERICLSRYLMNRGVLLDPFADQHPLSKECSRYLNPSSWKCSMVWSAYMGLPLSLEGVSAVLGLEKQKLSEGKNLIRYFCIPCKPTKVNGGRSRNLPEHDKEKWEQFISYNVRDVETEIEIQRKLSKFPVPDEIWNEYHLDQEINDRGILVDMTFVNQAIAIDEKARAGLMMRLQCTTGLAISIMGRRTGTMFVIITRQLLADRTLKWQMPLSHIKVNKEASEKANPNIKIGMPSLAKLSAVNAEPSGKGGR